MHLLNNGQMKNTALILIDIQKAFDDLEYWGGNRNNPQAEQKASELLEFWRTGKLPLFHIKHDSVQKGSKLAPDEKGNEIKDIVKPRADEVVIRKNVNSAFIGTDLKKRLDEVHIRSLVLVGLTTDHCVSTTARMAGNLGFETFVIDDATATFDRKDKDGTLFQASVMHKTALASLHNEFATVLSANEIINTIKNA
jgi:nicotinamidase-related amidase